MNRKKIHYIIIISFFFYYYYRDYLKKLKYREDIVKIQADYGIHKGIIAMFPFFMAQAFTFITFYWSILKLSKTNQSFSEEGFLWVQSLASYDPIYLLPFISFISLVGVFEVIIITILYYEKIN